jgi:hypothetical protein
MQQPGALFWEWSIGSCLPPVPPFMAREHCTEAVMHGRVLSAALTGAGAGHLPGAARGNTCRLPLLLLISMCFMM